MLDAEIVKRADGYYYIIIEDRPDAIGPFTRSELRAIWEALLEWRDEF